MVGSVRDVLCQHRCMARHRGKARHPVMIGGAVLLVAALAVGGGYAVMNRGDADSPASGAAGTSTSSSSTSSGGSSPSSGTPSTSAAGSSGTASASGAASAAAAGSTSTSSTTPAGVDAPAVAALASCTTTVRAQERLARAAAASARDWGLHTDAQRKFDSGVFTAAQTKAQWAASKARGLADLAAYERAVKAVQRAGDGCRKGVAAAAGSPVEATAKRCARRSTALARVARTGGVVNRQWAAHLAMMAHKEHSGAAEYLDRWAGMVKESGPALAAYRAAAAALAQAPACPT